MFIALFVGVLLAGDGGGLFDHSNKRSISRTSHTGEDLEVETANLGSEEFKRLALGLTKRDSMPSRCVQDLYGTFVVWRRL